MIMVTQGFLFLYHTIELFFGSLYFFKRFAPVFFVAIGADESNNAHFPTLSNDESYRRESRAIFLCSTSGPKENFYNCTPRHAARFQQYSDI